MQDQKNKPRSITKTKRINIKKNISILKCEMQNEFIALPNRDAPMSRNRPR